MSAPTPLTGRALLLQQGRDLIDYLDAHPDIPVERITARAGYIIGDRPRQLAALHTLARRLDGAILINDHFTVHLQRRTGDEVFWEAIAETNRVCTPRVQDDEIIWELPKLPGVEVGR